MQCEKWPQKSLKEKLQDMGLKQTEPTGSCDNSTPLFVPTTVKQTQRESLPTRLTTDLSEVSTASF